jgi:hypothetical protein
LFREDTMPEFERKRDQMIAYLEAALPKLLARTPLE